MSVFERITGETEKDAGRRFKIHQSDALNLLPDIQSSDPSGPIPFPIPFLPSFLPSFLPLL
ncbi:hypothetical protein EYF80_042495 [Liparis tanakae]|uniref:Uncharacterized protein n=1 Tax=Liparis tanakae TaxID=230148 RepID=A0A4Z2G2K9_9TELE|nr:hypothetical protein EYF80_042495 [Liparis tanakae]